MSGRWGAVNARARGLETHLLSRAAIAALADAPDLETLADRLRGLGFTLPEGGGATAADLELAVRRRSAQELRTLSRWAAGRAELTSVLYDEEDRRGVRALLRGAVERAPAEERIAGLIPTPALPERALAELARAPTPAAVAALLAAWRHPYGPPLLPLARSAQPDLFALELALGRAVAARLAAAGARGGAALTAYVRDTIDVENALGAIALARESADVAPRDAFLPGGRAITAGVIADAAATRDPTAAAGQVAAAFGSGPLAAALRRGATEPGALEDAVLRARIAALRSAARHDPLGPAPLLGFALALRAQTVDLHRVIWGVALGAPPPLVARELVTAA